MSRLLDVNMLVALAWPNHVHHAMVEDWFLAHHDQGWATCAVTEMGFVRVSSNARVIPTAVHPAEALGVLRELTELTGHEFWGDGVTGVVGGRVDPALVATHRMVTDAHLLALVLERDGWLVTLDRGVRQLAGGERGSAVICLLDP